MKSFICSLVILTMIPVIIFAEQNCLTKNEIIELDSLVSIGQVQKLQDLINSKYEFETDTFYLNYQIKFFKKAKEKLVLLEGKISQFNQISSIVQNNVLINFKNNKNRFEDPSVNPKIGSLYKECVESDSLELCFIAQYYLQKHQDYLDTLLLISDTSNSEYFDKCMNQLNKFDKNLTYKKINICNNRIDSLIQTNNSTVSNIKQHQKCLGNALLEYTNIIKSIHEFNNYDDSTRLELSDQLKLKEDLYSIENAGEKSYQQFVIFKNSDPLNNQTIFNYLLAKKLKTEHILQQKHQMRNQIIEVKSLQNNKQYNEALNNLEKFRKELPTIQVYKYFSDSLKYEYDKLEVEIKDQRYKDSFWISTKKLDKKYQLLFGLGIHYNPALLNMKWHFLSTVDDREILIPVYKLRESVGIQFSGEFSFHYSPKVLFGAQILYGNIYIIKAILADSPEIFISNKQESERINSYTINTFDINVFSKYYLRHSPGLNPYIKFAFGAVHYRRNAVSLEKLLNAKDIFEDEKDLYLIKKSGSDIYLSPEFGVDFLKFADSSWILSVFLNTILMTGGPNQMLGHFRGSAGIKIGKYW